MESACPTQRDEPEEQTKPIEPSCRAKVVLIEQGKLGLSQAVTDMLSLFNHQPLILSSPTQDLPRFQGEQKGPNQIVGRLNVKTFIYITAQGREYGEGISS
jgi:hypothetical protein